MDSSEKNKKYKAILELEKNKEIKVLLKSIDNHKNEIHKLSKRKDYLWTAIHEKLRYSWTYNTNAIEGSTLSEGDTIFFLKEGLTVEGKPFKDFLDAKNHHEAIEFLYEVVKNSRSISESLIKEFNALLLSGVKYTKAINESGQQVEKLATPGKYKIEPNHVLQSDGTIHYYVEPIQVAPQMQDLVEWINDNIEKLHPVILGAAAHYDFVRIHPFDDGNGRGARLLMNLILIKKELPPAVIKNEKRRFYIESLIQADNGDLKSFVEFITRSLLNTQKMIIEAIKHDGENK